MNQLKQQLAKILPNWVLSFYHLTLAWVGSVVCGFPSRFLIVIGITGTKGKTSVVEMVNAILEEAGYKTALINSIRIKVGEESRDNTMRMSMPGHFYIQRFLAKALAQDCNVAILEMTSEGARQHRHRFIDLDALVFTNLAPEHIESHGSFEAYADAKLSIGKQLERSAKRPRTIVANADDKESSRYFALQVDDKIPFSLAAVSPSEAGERASSFTFDGEKITLQLPGEFSLMNALAAASLAHTLGIRTSVIARALNKIRVIPGRAERIELGQPFDVVIDYAHTPDSLLALYKTYPNKKKICVLGAAVGGRDTWKRPVMGRIADEHCGTIILTNEDPYDEDPEAIVEDMAHAMSKSPEIVMDRREAIRRALALAATGDIVLITGKGTNHEICGPKGTKIPWSDKDVVEEELKQLLRARAS